MKALDLFIYLIYSFECAIHPCWLRLFESVLDELSEDDPLTVSRARKIECFSVFTIGMILNNLGGA